MHLTKPEPRRAPDQATGGRWTRTNGKPGRHGAIRHLWHAEIMATMRSSSRTDAPHPRLRSSGSGFSLIEMMIVLVILAILAAVAWPSYNDSVRKSRRAAAMSAIAKVMQAQERARSNRATYVNGITSAELTGAPATSEGGHYTLTTTTESATATSSYTVVATAGTSQSGDTQCAKLLAVVSNGSVSYSSRNSSGDAPTGADPCWVK